MSIKKYLGQIVNVEALCRGSVEKVADGEGNVEDALEGQVVGERLQAQLEVGEGLADLLLQHLEVHLERPEAESCLQSGD